MSLEIKLNWIRSQSSPKCKNVSNPPDNPSRDGPSYHFPCPLYSFTVRHCPVHWSLTVTPHSGANINNYLFRHIPQRISKVFYFDKWVRVIKRLVHQQLKDWKSLLGWPFKIFIDQNPQTHHQREIRKIMKLIRGKFMVFNFFS